MNKQIKTLMGQALDKAVPYTWHSLDYIEVEKVLQEFAELMVSECVAQCEKNKDHEWLGSGSKLSASNIKEYFGVEE